MRQLSDNEMMCDDEYKDYKDADLCLQRTPMMLADSQAPKFTPFAGPPAPPPLTQVFGTAQNVSAPASAPSLGHTDTMIPSALETLQDPFPCPPNAPSYQSVSLRCPLPQVGQSFRARPIIPITCSAPLPIAAGGSIGEGFGATLDLSKKRDVPPPDNVMSGGGLFAGRIGRQIADELPPPPPKAPSSASPSLSDQLPAPAPVMESQTLLKPDYYEQHLSHIREAHSCRDEKRRFPRRLRRTSIPVPPEKVEPMSEAPEALKSFESPPPPPPASSSGLLSDADVDFYVLRASPKYQPASPSKGASPLKKRVSVISERYRKREPMPMEYTAPSCVISVSDSISEKFTIGNGVMPTISMDQPMEGDFPVQSIPILSQDLCFRKCRKTQTWSWRDDDIPKWTQIFELQHPEKGYWELTAELGHLLNVDVSRFANDFLQNKGIKSLGTKAHADILKLLATLLVLQLMRVKETEVGRLLRTLFCLEDSEVRPDHWEAVERAVKWARWADRQYPCVYSRLEFGLSWDSSTKQLLGFELIHHWSPLTGLNLNQAPVTIQCLS